MQGHMYENIMSPITDGKRLYNISGNLKAAYETEGKEIVKSFEKAIPVSYTHLSLFETVIVESLIEE